MQHYYAIAERARGEGWVLTFPGSAGRSFAENVDQIVQQAQDWLASTGMPWRGSAVLDRGRRDAANQPG